MRVRSYLAMLVLPLSVAACDGGTGPASGEAAGSSETTAAGASDAPTDQGPALASVGDVKVFQQEFEAMAARKTPANGESLSLEEKKEILDKLVEEKALYQEAKKKGVDQDPKVQKVMINTLLRQEVYSGVRNTDFTQEELRKYFDEHRDEFVVPEKVQIKRIFVRVSEERSAADAKKLADDLRGQAKANPSKFGDIASEHSEDPYRRRGGDLGFVGRDGKPGIDQAVVDKAFAMKVGDVSEAFEAGGGYNVLYVANKRDRVERTFEQMRGSVLRKVKNEKYREMYESYVKGVVGEYTVTIDEATLATIEVDPAKMPRIGPGPGMGPGPMGIRGGDDEGDEPMGEEGDE